MKKYPLFALVFLLLLLVGTAFGLREQKPTDEIPMCQSPCFWGYVYGIPIHSPHGDVVNPSPLAGATMELWFEGAPTDTCQTNHLGFYCFHISPDNSGDYIIKVVIGVVCCEKQVHHPGGYEDIRVDFRGVLCPPTPNTPVQGDPQP